MIEITNVNIFGWETAIRGARNPMNSWSLMDTKGDVVGAKDLDLAMRLSKSGTDHRKFMRMIIVQMDINAPRYWWTEFDTYKVGTVANSCSTMHKIHSKEFTIQDFSHEHLNGRGAVAMYEVIRVLNGYRDKFLATEDKDYWWNMIQLLPQSYNQLRTITLNYEVLCNMYHARKYHKLDEWREFCKWIESLPYSELIIEGA